MSLLPDRSPSALEQEQVDLAPEVTETLVTSDLEGELAPGLATAWTTSSDHTEWRFDPVDGQLQSLKPELVAGLIISAPQLWLTDWLKSGRNRAPSELADELVDYLRRTLAKPVSGEPASG